MLRTETFLVGPGTSYLDWAGTLQQGGRLGDEADCAIAVNCYDGEELVGSLVYERYPSGSLDPSEFPGPYFHAADADELALLHTVYVEEAYRGQGVLYLLLAPLVERWLPVYVNRWQNVSLGERFERDFQPDGRFAVEICPLP
jgi:GNAT superfamily N-acetyltransferase